MSKELLSKKINAPYYYSFKIINPGLAAISIAARCKSKKQINSTMVNTAEALEYYYKELKISVEKNIFKDITPARIEKLKDPETNIKYVAAKINFSQNRWAEAGYDISNKPEIIGTLYNLEDVNKPIPPHRNPEANKFGKGVKQNFDKVKVLLGL